MERIKKGTKLLFISDVGYNFKQGDILTFARWYGPKQSWKSDTPSFKRIMFCPKSGDNWHRYFQAKEFLDKGGYDNHSIPIQWVEPLDLDKHLSILGIGKNLPIFPEFPSLTPWWKGFGYKVMHGPKG